jgi:hypothetical protein
MTLAAFDWAIIAVYFLFNLAISLYYARRAQGSVSEFFLSGRDAPWWLAGTSMVATTFAADTPLVVTGLVARYGIAGNWLWWNMAASGMLTVFVYARLWRRSGVMTDVEFAEIRYAGRPAAFLRGFRMPGELPEGCDYSAWLRLRDEWRLAVRIWRKRRSEPEREREIISQHGQHVALHVLRSKRAVREFLDGLDADHIEADDG